MSQTHSLLYSYLYHRSRFRAPHLFAFSNGFNDCVAFWRIFPVDLDRPEYPNNDRLIFSKGHTAPLFYALYAAAGMVSEEEMLTLRKFGSPLESHPTPRFRSTEAAAGSLGQELSLGVVCRPETLASRARV